MANLIDFLSYLLKIKEMSEVVEGLKEEKEQTDYKLQQYENIIKCQKLEIESKSSILKQLELVTN